MDWLTILEDGGEDIGNLLDLEECAEHAGEDEDKAREVYSQLAQTENCVRTIALSEFGDLTVEGLDILQRRTSQDPDEAQ